MSDPPRATGDRRKSGRAASPTITRGISIGDIAHGLGISTRAIRFYESCGLIKPERKGAIRTFGPADRARLVLILRAKNLGLSLDEIGEHLALHDSATADQASLATLKALADRHIAVLNAKRTDIGLALRELQQISKALPARIAAARGPDS